MDVDVSFNEFLYRKILSFVNNRMKRTQSLYIRVTGDRVLESVSSFVPQ